MPRASLIANPPVWPGGAACAVCFSFDMDAESLLHVNHNGRAHEMIAASSALRYGPEIAIPRIAEILRRYGLRQTFFIPGWCIEAYPRAIELLLADGHEIAHHGWLHERPNQLSPSDEARVLDRAIEAFRHVVGADPIGYRAPAYALSSATTDLLIERGFRYDASLLGDDVPYVIRGARGELIELPSDYALDDWVQFVNMKEFGFAMPIRAPQRAREVFQAEFDAAWRNGGSWISVWHPFVSGRLARAEAMIGLIEHMLEKGGVWFATLAEMATHVEELRKDGRWSPRVDELPFRKGPVELLVTPRPQ